MENTFSYRYFLLINYLANQMVNVSFLNFAELIKSENEGRFMNSQMTFYFNQLDDVFSELMGNNVGWVFEELSLDELAEIPAEQLEDDYITYCVDDEEFLKFKMP
jgi:hypothetical protein